jgi:hypothetical protein
MVKLPKRPLNNQNALGTPEASVVAREDLITRDYAINSEINNNNHADFYTQIVKQHERANKVVRGHAIHMPTIFVVEKLPWPTGYDRKTNSILVRETALQDYDMMLVANMVAHEIGEAFYYEFHKSKALAEKFPIINKCSERFADEFSAHIIDDDLKLGRDKVIETNIAMESHAKMDAKSLQRFSEWLSLPSNTPAEEILAAVTNTLRQAYKLKPDQPDEFAWHLLEKASDTTHPTCWERNEYLQNINLHTGMAGQEKERKRKRKNELE